MQLLTTHQPIPNPFPAIDPKIPRSHNPTEVRENPLLPLLYILSMTLRDMEYSIG